MDRRTFVKGAAAGIGAAALGANRARADQANLVLPSLGAVAEILVPTKPKGYYPAASQPAGLKNTVGPPEAAGKQTAWVPGRDWPTVSDLCPNGGVTSSYSLSHLPETASWGAPQLW